MENQLLHTPEGVRDIYNGECERKLEILARMNQEIRNTVTIRFRPLPLSSLISSARRWARPRPGISTSSLTGRAIRWCFVRI